jgi:hypothetical protein
LYTRFTFLTIALALSISQGFCSFENQTYQELLKENYKCNLVKENVFLNKDQIKKIKEKVDFRVSALLLRYKNSCNNSFIYIDSHIVRTMNETVVIELNKSDVKVLKIASFMEPKEYLPPQKWLNQFQNKKVKVDGLTGATISENAIKRLVEKYIVIDNILNDKV